MKASHAAVLLAFVLLGAAAGLGAYTFVYARGWSCLTNDPRACANCHVMNEQVKREWSARLLHVSAGSRAVSRRFASRRQLPVTSTTRKRALPLPCSG